MVGKNRNLPMEEQTGLLGKIKILFRRLFYKICKNNTVNSIAENNNNIINKKVFKEQFNNLLKIEDDNNVKKERDELFKKIINNPGLLNYLTIDQLKMFIKFGNKVIKNNNEIIKAKEFEIEKLKKLN